MNVPKISIIVPVYNKAGYVLRCMESLLRQTFRDFEVIVVNDGSTDESGRIVERYVQQDNRVRYFSKENGGVSSARNYGLMQARGEWLTFVDADDYVGDNYLADIMSNVAVVDADLYLWGVTYDYSNGTSTKAAPMLKGKYSRADFMREMVADQFKANIGLYGYVANKLIRRSLVEENKLRFNPAIKIMEDYDFYLSYYAVMQSAVVFDNIGYHYLMEAENSSLSLVREVDYLPLIDTQLECKSVVKANGGLTEQNDILINNNIISLAQSALLEMQKPTIDKLKTLAAGFTKRGIDVKSLGFNRRMMRYALQDKSMTALCVYLKVWRKYLSIRQRV